MKRRKAKHGLKGNSEKEKREQSHRRDGGRYRRTTKKEKEQIEGKHYNKTCTKEKINKKTTTL